MSAQKPKEKVTVEQLKRHIKTHSKKSEEDREAIKALDYCLTLGGKLYTNFAVEDKWPNVDGDFELVPNPEFDRQPKKKFTVQIKGTKTARIAQDGTIHYQLKVDLSRKVQSRNAQSLELDEI